MSARQHPLFDTPTGFALAESLTQAEIDALPWCQRAAYWAEMSAQAFALRHGRLTTVAAGRVGPAWRRVEGE